MSQPANKDDIASVQKQQQAIASAQAAQKFIDENQQRLRAGMQSSQTQGGSGFSRSGGYNGEEETTLGELRRKYGF